VPDQKNLVVGLDLGSRTFRCVAATLERGMLRHAGSAAVPARGWQRGRVTDPQAVAASITEVVGRVEEQFPLTIARVVLGVAGPSVRGVNSRGQCELWPPREIAQFDVNRAVERACGLQFRDDHMILQVFPQYFTVDHDNEYRDPRGIPGSLLEANVHILITSKNEHEALVGLCNQVHLQVEDTVFEPVATALATVLPSDRFHGVALADIGMHSTDLVVYWKEMLVHSASIPIGAEPFTRDVAAGLQVAPPQAEQLKLEYGCALMGLTADHSKIELPPVNGKGRREARRRSLNYILEARGRELMGHIAHELKVCQMEGNLGTGLLLAGGGALLPGLCDLAEQVLNCPSRLALPIGICDLPDRLNDASWSTAAGLAMYAARLRVQEQQRQQQESLLVRLFG
jgi:cell division protein FtsA